MKNLIITLLGWIMLVVAIAGIVIAALLVRAGKISGYDFVITCWIGMALLFLSRLLPKNRMKFKRRVK